MILRSEKKFYRYSCFYLVKHHSTPSSMHYTKRLWMVCIPCMSSDRFVIIEEHLRKKYAMCTIIYISSVFIILIPIGNLYLNIFICVGTAQSCDIRFHGRTFVLILWRVTWCTFSRWKQRKLILNNIPSLYTFQNCFLSVWICILMENKSNIP